MNDLIPVKVISHAGYKADEYPRCFYLDQIRFDIVEILDRWYQGDLNPDFPPAGYFKVKTTDDKVYILKNDCNSGNWFLWIRGEKLNL